MDSDGTHKGDASGTADMAPETLLALQELALKLDAILMVLFQQLQSFNQTTKSIPNASDPRLLGSSPTKASTAEEEALVTLRANLFDSLLTIFDNCILRTFKIRHTQFILFYVASLSPSFSDSFTGSLLTRALYEPDTPAVTRIASCGYLASFIARARFIDIKVVRNAMSLLCVFMDEQLHSLSIVVGSSMGQAGLLQFAVFYAAAQAAMYIFCFRWKDLLLDDDEVESGNELDVDVTLASDTGRRWWSDLQALRAAVLSPLNPMKVPCHSPILLFITDQSQVCSPPVVAQFAAVARQVGFGYFYSILDANKRSAQRSSKSGPSASVPPTPMPRSDSRSLFELDRPDSPVSMAPTNHPLIRQALTDAQVDSHFPFEPYKLPCTKTFIQDIYLEWKAPDGMEETSGSEMEEDADAPVSISRGQGLAIPGADNSSSSNDEEEDDWAGSLEAMSISPQRRHSVLA